MQAVARHGADAGQRAVALGDQQAQLGRLAGGEADAELDFRLGLEPLPESRRHEAVIGGDVQHPGCGSRPGAQDGRRDQDGAGLRQLDGAVPDKACVAALVYVYDHARRDLPNRLAHEFHSHHDLAVSALHVHLDARSCLEVAVLRGPAGAMRHMADHVTAERGVQHGQLVLLPAGSADPPAGSGLGEG